MPAKEEDSSGRADPNKSKQEALEAALREHGNHVFAFLYSISGGDVELVRDLAQDTWLKVYKYLRPEQFGEISLLLRKARQVFIDHQRRQRMRHLVEYRDDVANLPLPAESRGQEGLKSEEFVWDEFWGLFDSSEFDPVDMKCVWLIHRYGYTVQEVAGRVNLPPSTVHDRVSRLLGKCREILSGGEQ
jgi:RNA polymerase sigma factor (sigma-70 family)